MNNIFKAGYMGSWKYPRTWFRNIRQFFRNIKYAWQRATKGYSNWDMWDLDTFYIELLRDSLKEFAEKTIAYPGNEEFPTIESWKEYLLKMADHFDKSRLDYSEEHYENPYQIKYFELLESEDFCIKNGLSEIGKKYWDWNLEHEPARLKHRAEALKSLDYVFDSLWI